jgi:ATP-dependent DNA helicase DinG
METIKRKGKNPFMTYQLPRAIISLKQGLGRLMRKKSDRGVLAVLDSRIYKRAYGQAFIKSLPPARITHELSELKRFVG